MAIVRASELSFAYAATGKEAAAAKVANDRVSGMQRNGEAVACTTPRNAFDSISFEIEEGAFCLLVGLTGCGKTTLLRAMKPELSPEGSYAGSLEVCGVRLVDDGKITGAMPASDSASQIGFVMQDPDTQIVCDTVWHELAFGLENLGTDSEIMRRRVAESAHYFGIAPWVERKTDQLSGGQKQLLNLAAILALRPRLILLDEPTSQLDPAAKQHFIFMLDRVHRELGITVVMATHAPEEVAHLATQVIRMSDIGEEAPLSAVGRFAHSRIAGNEPAGRTDAATSSTVSSIASRASEVPIVLSASDLYVRHNMDDPWVLHGFSMDVRQGTIHAVVGGNGSGKSTLLRTLAGDMKVRRGRVRNDNKNAQAFLPQDPKAVFVCDSVEEELCEWQDRAGYSDDEIEAAKQRFGLAGMEGRHPYDLSGGQRQNLALAKLLLCKPRLLLLDEPTKGLDAQACATVVRILRQLASEGVTIVLSTHDLDVAAVCADEATLLFDGQAICTQGVPQFFEDNLIWRPHEKSRLYGVLK